ncbi:HIRAN domain-containing protein [Saccharothrix sp. Mg75]|uniref:HIRAN domain-containing protein n=1 Tax=Saccharothrix sp. Mg75 TaxID=3445357 RepID=UPI003EED1675
MHRTTPVVVALVTVSVALALTLAVGPVGLAASAVAGVLAVFLLIRHRTSNAALPRPVPLPVPGPLDVVGEAGHQAELARFTDRETTALLVPEPSNPYDPHAVRVDLLDADGTPAKVGYLSRAAARRHQPLLSELARRGEVASCPAHVARGALGLHGVRLITTG